MENKRAQYRDAKAVEKKNKPHVFKLLKTKYSLNRVNRKEWEVMSTAAVLDYVSSRGFNEILFIKRIGVSKSYIKKGEEIYILTSMFQGQKLKLKNEESGLAFAELLAKFHNAAEGFTQPPGIKLRVDWGKRMERLRTSTSRLEKYINYVNSREKLNEFEEYTLKYTEILIKRARASMKILKSLGYLRALEGSMKRKEICINGISNRTAIMNGDRLVISRIFELGYNMVEEDIAALIKKVIQETGDKTLFDSVAGRYFETREAGEDSEKIIRALISYPSDSIKVILKYYDHARNTPEEDLLYNTAMLKKLKKYINKELLTDVLEG